MKECDKIVNKYFGTLCNNLSNLWEVEVHNKHNYIIRQVALILLDIPRGFEDFYHYCPRGWVITPYNIFP